MYKTLYILVKLPKQPVVRAASDCFNSSHRLFVTDVISKRQFLADSGSDLSIYPKKLLQERRQRTDYELSAANESPIPTYGTILLNLNLGLRRDFRWRFIVADVAEPIIGADFLAHYNLLVDLRNKKLIDGTTLLKVSGIARLCDFPNIKAVSGNSQYHQLLACFPDITRPAGAPREVKHSTVHHIRTTPGPPVACRTRRLAPDRLRVAKAEFEGMVRIGIVRPSESSWSSPLHMVPKKNATWRPCGDFRALNARTVHDCYPVKNVMDFTFNLAGCSIFSVIDLVQAFTQIPMAPEDIPKTAITTPFGLFEFLYMPYGLRNAAQTFQRFMDEVLRGLNFCVCHIDDILISSKTPQEHEDHLRQVFQRLSDHGIVINPAKCVLGQTEVTFLGHTVSANGVCPLAEKVAAIKSIPLPETAQQLRRFLGMFNFYRRFLPDAAALQAPLDDALAGPKIKGSQPIDMTPERCQAFQKCKDALSRVALLSHPEPDAPQALFTDASEQQIGGVVQQFVAGSWQPLAFFSKKLSKQQSLWFPYDRELFAIYKSVRYFSFLLEGRAFTIFTDHKPITYVFQQKADSLTPKQRKWVGLIAQYSSDIQHISGKENVVADALSRIDVVEAPPDYKALATSQQDDNELKTLLREGSALQLNLVPIPGSESNLYCDTSMQRPRPFVTAPFRRQVFNTLHGLSHPGVRATAKLVSQRFVWPGMRSDCRRWTRACLPCQQSKVTRHVRAPLSSFTLPPSRFAHVHVDIIGPLPPSAGYRYCLTAIDRFTRWPEVIPTEDITAETIAKALVSGWVSRFGSPSRITTDRGRQFEAHLFRALASLIGFRQSRSTAYHPQANGMVERFHRQLKAAIMCHVNESWTDALPFVLLGIRAAWKEDLQASSAELVYGEPLRIPGEFFAPANTPQVDNSEFVARLRRSMAELRPRQASRHSVPATFIFKDLATALQVMVRDDTVRGALQPPYIGPYTVIRHDKKTVTIQRHGQEDVISIDRVKPAYVLSEDAPLLPAPSPALHPAVQAPVSEPIETSRGNPQQTITRSGRRVRFPDFYQAR